MTDLDNFPVPKREAFIEQVTEGETHSIQLYIEQALEGENAPKDASELIQMMIKENLFPVSIYEALQEEFNTLIGSILAKVQTIVSVEAGGERNEGLRTVVEPTIAQEIITFGETHAEVIEKTRDLVVSIPKEVVSVAGGLEQLVKNHPDSIKLENHAKYLQELKQINELSEKILDKLIKELIELLDTKLNRETAFLPSKEVLPKKAPQNSILFNVPMLDKRNSQIPLEIKFASVDNQPSKFGVQEKPKEEKLIEDIEAFWKEKLDALVASFGVEVSVKVSEKVHPRYKELTVDIIPIA